MQRRDWAKGGIFQRSPWIELGYSASSQMLLLFLHFGEENKAASLKPAKLYNLFTELESYQVNYLKNTNLLDQS